MMNLLLITLEGLETPKTDASMFLLLRKIWDLACGLNSYFKEKLDGFDFFTVNQVMQRALAIES
jgi:hypothetical protein